MSARRPVVGPSRILQWCTVVRTWIDRAEGNLRFRSWPVCSVGDDSTSLTAALWTRGNGEALPTGSLLAGSSEEALGLPQEPRERAGRQLIDLRIA